MSEMNDLAAFLRTRLDEDEWWAREASTEGGHRTVLGEHWQWECETTDKPVIIDPMFGEYVEGVDYSSVGLRSVEHHPTESVGPLPHLVIHGQREVRTVDAGHIARWDPARVLAEVAAKRRILDEHQPIDGVSWHGCTTCDAQGWGSCGCAGSGDWPCDTVKLLALPYADHPDYREEWRP